MSIPNVFFRFHLDNKDFRSISIIEAYPLDSYFKFDFISQHKTWPYISTHLAFLYMR